ncbi:MAG: 30S ribosomal protein S1 [Candidatus Omnitrophota bacterium]
MSGKQRINESRQDLDGKEESFEKMLEESFQSVRNLDIGEEVKARVIGFDNDNVFLDLGTRVDGMLRKTELVRKGRLTVKEGDRITVFITGKGKGYWQCSSRLGTSEQGEQDPQRVAALMTLEEAFHAGTPVTGKVFDSNKGGFKVNIMGIDTFCPISQIGSTYCDKPEEHLNKTYTFLIIQYEDEGNNIVVSRREFLDQEAKQISEKLWQKVEAGQVYEGTVKSVQDFGAFIDIGGIEGLLHISEISYMRIAKVSDVLTLGQKVKVAVIEVDRKNRKLSLSLKSLMDDPWVDTIKDLKVGGEYQGKVVRMKTFGAFIELFPGVDGMVHISRLGTNRRHQHPKEVLNVGDMVTVRILEIDEANRRISLTMEQEEVDYSKDLRKLKDEQDEAAKAAPTHLSHAFDSADKKKRK